MTLFSLTGLETMPGITILELLMFPCPELDVDHLTGLWINSLPGWLTQLRLFLSGSPITISHSKQSSALLPMLPHAKIWGDLHPPLQPPKPDLCCKRSLFEVKICAWHLSQAIKADKVFITNWPVRVLSEGLDHLLCWLHVWVTEQRKREWEEEARHFSRELYPQTQPGVIIPHQRHHI